MNNSMIEYLEKQYQKNGRIDALGFSKYSGCQNWEDCLEAFKSAVDHIANRDLKTLQSDKENVHWARKIRKKNYTVSVKEKHY